MAYRSRSRRATSADQRRTRELHWRGSPSPARTTSGSLPLEDARLGGLSDRERLRLEGSSDDRVRQGGLGGRRPLRLEGGSCDGERLGLEDSRGDEQRPSREQRPLADPPQSLQDFLVTGKDMDDASSTQAFVLFGQFALSGQASVDDIYEVSAILGAFMRGPGALLFYMETEFVQLTLSHDGGSGAGSGSLASPGPLRTLAWKFWATANKPPLTLPPPPQRAAFPPPAPLGLDSHTLATLAQALRHPAAAPRRNSILAEVEPEEDSSLFDLARFIRKTSHGTFCDLDLGWFSDLRKLHQLDTESRKRGFQLLASTGFEEWNPQWLGMDKSSSARKALHSERTKSYDLSGFPKILGNIMTYWLSHAAVGIVSLASVFAHNLCLVRLADERSVKFVIIYERRLIVRLLEKIRGGEQCDFSAAISRIDSGLLDRLDIEDAKLRPLPAARDPKPAPARDLAKPRAALARKPARGSSPRRRSRSNDRRRHRTPPRDARRQPAPQSSTKEPPRRRPLCFDHDPANRRVCQLGKDCPKEHLDTKDASLRERFSKAKTAFDARVGNAR